MDLTRARLIERMEMLEELVGTALTRSRREACAPSFAEKLEHAAFNIACLRDIARPINDRHASLGTLEQALEELCGASPSTTRPYLAEACELLRNLREPFITWLVDTAPVVQAPMPAAFLRANQGEPSLYELDNLSPLRVSSVQRGRWRQDNELNLGLRGSASFGERNALEDLALDALEDIAALGNLRRLADDEPLLRAMGFEQRLLANLDYVVTLARGAESIDLVRELSRYLCEAVISDSGRTFAVAFVLACLSGRASLPGLRRLVLGADERQEQALVDAIALGSNPLLDEFVLQLMHEDAEVALRISLGSCLRRRVVQSNFIAFLEHPSPRVASLAARALVFVPDPSHVAHALGGQLDGPPDVAAAALGTLAISGHPLAFRIARSHAERAASEGPADLLRDVAMTIVKRRTDSEAMLKALADLDTPQAERRALWFEASLAANRPLSIDVDGFVGPQLRLLQSMTRPKGARS